MPDELEASAQDLAHALIHVRCSDIAVEGEEESAELRRHNALVSLLVCSTLKTIEVVTRELYSAQVDISQRLLILDVMTGEVSVSLSCGDLNCSFSLLFDQETAHNLLVIFRCGTGVGYWSFL